MLITLLDIRLIRGNIALYGHQLAPDKCMTDTGLSGSMLIPGSINEIMNFRNSIAYVLEQVSMF